MSASLHVPLSISASTREKLSLEILRVQSEQGGKVSIISIYYDPDKKEHICWYFPIKYLGGGLL